VWDMLIAVIDRLSGLWGAQISDDLIMSDYCLA
jgi:hypothetical protein